MNDLDQSIVGWKRRKDRFDELTSPLSEFLQRQGDPVETEPDIFVEWQDAMAPRLFKLNGHIWIYGGIDAGNETT